MEWIETAEKLPPISVAVMIYDEGGLEQVSYGYWSGDHWVDYMEKERRPRSEVTHWLMMPEPPRKFRIANGQEKPLFQFQRRTIGSLK